MIGNPVDPRAIGPHIDVKDYFELRSWAKRFGVTPGDVRRAVSRVGAVPKDVESYLEYERLGGGAQLPGKVQW